MRILPVIDLKDGLVVRGVAGRREEYRPVVSKLAADTTPRGIARAFRAAGAQDVYVADLDAIGGAEPDWESLRQISSEGLSLYLDCGVGTPERARQAARFSEVNSRVEAIVVGLESVAGPGELKELFGIIGRRLGVFSLDLRDGVPLSKATEWQGMSPLEIARCAYEIGFMGLIVLDLAQVGVGQGPSVAGLCREVRLANPKTELIAGGGVRNKEDLALLAEAGCSRALVASALHDGVITRL